MAEEKEEPKLAELLATIHDRLDALKDTAAIIEYKETGKTPKPE